MQKWTPLFALIALVFSTQAHAKIKKRLIVKYKSGQMEKSLTKSTFKAFAKSRGLDRVIIKSKDDQDFESMKAQLAANPEVEYVEEDRVFNHFYEPGDGGTIEDQSYHQQWHLFENYGINAPAAWDVTLGSSSTVVAVVDTGITSHPDLDGKVLPGADLISDPNFSNDGGGRDNDASDPGDYIQWGDGCYRGWPVDSSWHGTHVAGTIAAKTGNGTGVAGVDWNAKILPVRVLGKCGGYESDIADGVRWAAGVPVSGVGTNPNPAKVINMSLGGQGPCSFTMQNAINEANARGAVVVVAAGNDNTNMNFTSYSPANCNGVLVVAAANRNGGRAYYSNYGNKVDIAAPGGDGSGSVLSTHNSGQKDPGFATYSTMNGTSMAAPHVAGVVSLIFAVQPGLYPGQVRDIVRNSASSFPGSSNCTTSTCGHGMLDAYQAVVEAQVTSPDPNYVPNDPAGNGGISGSAPLYTYYEDDGGAGCGTIDTSGGSGGPGGGNKMLGYLMMMLMGTVLAQMMGRRKA